MEDFASHLQAHHKYTAHILRSNRMTITLPTLIDGDMSSCVCTYQNNNFLFEAEVKNKLVYFNMYAIQPKEVQPTHTIHMSTKHPTINYQYTNTIPSIQHYANCALVIPYFQFGKLMEAHENPHDGVDFELVFQRINAL
jgi:hypothetical protein